jgi:hypothetical protein
MRPTEKQKIEIEKLHRDPLPPLNQAVKADYSDFLGTALIEFAKYITSLHRDGGVLLCLRRVTHIEASNPNFQHSLRRCYVEPADSEGTKTRRWRGLGHFA